MILACIYYRNVVRDVNHITWIHEALGGQLSQNLNQEELCSTEQLLSFHPLWIL